MNKTERMLLSAAYNMLVCDGDKVSSNEEEFVGWEWGIDIIVYLLHPTQKGKMRVKEHLKYLDTHLEKVKVQRIE